MNAEALKMPQQVDYLETATLRVVQDIYSRLLNIDDNICVISQRIGGIEKRMSVIEERLESHDKRLNIIQSSITGLSSSMAEVIDILKSIHEVNKTE